MQNDILQQAMWWIGVVEIPVLVALFTLIWSVMRDLTNFRMEVARTYASAIQVRELEQRLTAHLLRIEAKLDTTALKAENLSAQAKFHEKGEM